MSFFDKSLRFQTLGERLNTIEEKMKFSHILRKLLYVVGYLKIRDVKAVEYFLLPLPAPYKISRFRICFRFQLLSLKCFRFHKKFNRFHRFRFHISA